MMKYVQMESCSMMVRLDENLGSIYSLLEQKKFEFKERIGGRALK